MRRGVLNSSHTWKKLRRATGRCVKERLKEHSYKLGVTGLPNLNVNISPCGNFKPGFEPITTVGRHRSRCGREVVEIFHPEKGGETNISHKPLRVTDKEMLFLNREPG